MGRQFKDRNLDRQTEEWSVVDESMMDLHQAPLHRAVYMFAAMTSIVVFQMYFVTFIISMVCAVISMRWFWTRVVVLALPMLLATVTIVLISTLIINR